MKPVLFFSLIFVSLACSSYEERQQERENTDYFESILERELAQMNGPSSGPKNILLRYKAVELSAVGGDYLQLQGKANWNRDSTSGSIGTDGSPYIGIVDDSWSLGLSVGSSHNTTQTTRTQYITVADGMEGSIDTGSIWGPYTVWGESLIIAPRIIEGNRMEIRLGSASLQRGGRYNETRTVVHVVSGQSILIGGSDLGNSRSSGSLLGSADMRESQQLVLILTPKILP